MVELRAARRAGDLQTAKEQCVRDLELARTSGTADREADAAIECGLVHLGSGDDAEARRMITLAQRWNRDYPPLLELARQLTDQPVTP